MKVLEETPGGPTILQIEAHESILVFHEDGEHEALIADMDDEDAVAKQSSVEIIIAIIALTDPVIRSIIEEKIADA